nr:uncharacterized protein LOC115256929 [Aedes albopictus]
MNEYLWEFAQKLPSDNPFQIVLKSALSVAASSEADLGKTNNKWMCRKCKTLWMHGYFQVDEVASTNRYDKLIEKYQNKPSRTRKQQAYLDYLLGRKHVIAKYTCKLCSYKTRFITDKRNAKPVQKSLTLNKEHASPSTAVTNSKRKKRQRDPTAGLSIPLTTKGNHKNVLTKKTAKQASFSSKEPSKLNALANMLKKKSEGMSSAEPLTVQDRLKLLLK